MNDRRQSDLEVRAQLHRTLNKLEATTYRHRSERDYHIRRSNIFVFFSALILVIIGGFNGYYIVQFYNDSVKMVASINNLQRTVRVVTSNMQQVSASMEQFKTHMDSMDTIVRNTESISAVLPAFRSDIDTMEGNMTLIDADMQGLSNDMALIDYRFNRITHGVRSMAPNVRSISKPMGMLNPFMP